MHMYAGVDYISTCKKYDLLTMINVGNKNGYELLEAASKVSKNIVYLLPKNSKITQLFEFSRKLSLFCRVENIYLHGKFKMLVA